MGNITIRTRIPVGCFRISVRTTPSTASAWPAWRRRIPSPRPRRPPIASGAWVELVLAAGGAAVAIAGLLGQAPLAHGEPRDDRDRRRDVRAGRRAVGALARPRGVLRDAPRPAGRGRDRRPGRRRHARRARRCARSRGSSRSRCRRSPGWQACFTY